MFFSPAADAWAAPHAVGGSAPDTGSSSTVAQPSGAGEVHAGLPGSSRQHSVFTSPLTAALSTDGCAAASPAAAESPSAPPSPLARSLSTGPQAPRTADQPSPRGTSGAHGADDEGFVSVVVRLKPQQKRMADAYMRYTIGPDGPGAQRPARRAATPRTARAGADGGGRSPLLRSPALSNSGTPSTTRAPRTARSAAASCTQPNLQSPMNPAVGAAAASSTGLSGRMLTLNCPGTRSGAEPEEQRSYEFSAVMDPMVSDEEMCALLVPDIVGQLLLGRHCCVLCYGQTGSGKTHTVNALAPSLTQAIFAHADSESCVVEVSYIQIYSNHSYDLLGRAAQCELGVPLPRLSGCAVSEPKQLVCCPEDVRELTHTAQKYRCTASHRLNARSSRSHTLLTFHVTQCIGGVPVHTTRVTLADLAGSEHVRQTDVHEESLLAAAPLSASPPTLPALLLTAVAESEGLPYHESLLTRYLAPRLREWHVVLIVTASLEKANAPETTASLDFATAARQCAVARVRPSASAGGTLRDADGRERYAQLTQVVAALHQQVAELTEELRADSNMRSPDAVPVEMLQRHEREIAALQRLLDDREEQLHVLRASADADAPSCAEAVSGATMWPDALAVPPLPPSQLPIPSAEASDSNVTGAEAGAAISGNGRAAVEPRDRVRTRTQELLHDLHRLLASPSPPISPAPHERLSNDVRTDVHTSELLGGLTEAFLQSHALLDSACEDYRVLGRATEGLRADNQRLRRDLQYARRELTASAEQVSALERQRLVRAAAAQRRKRELEDRHADLLMGLTGQTVWAEMASNYDSVEHGGLGGGDGGPAIPRGLGVSSSVDGRDWGDHMADAHGRGRLRREDLLREEYAERQASIEKNMSEERELQTAQQKELAEVRRRLETSQLSEQNYAALFHRLWAALSSSQRLALAAVRPSDGSVALSPLLGGSPNAAGAADVAAPGTPSGVSAVETVRLSERIADLQQRLDSAQQEARTATRLAQNADLEMSRLRREKVKLAQQLEEYRGQEREHLEAVEKVDEYVADMHAFFDDQAAEGVVVRHSFERQQMEIEEKDKTIRELQHELRAMWASRDAAGGAGLGGPDGSPAPQLPPFSPTPQPRDASGGVAAPRSKPPPEAFAPLLQKLQRYSKASSSPPPPATAAPVRIPQYHRPTRKAPSAGVVSGSASPAFRASGWAPNSGPPQPSQHAKSLASGQGIAALPQPTAGTRESNGVHAPAAPRRLTSATTRGSSSSATAPASKRHSRSDPAPRAKKGRRSKAAATSTDRGTAKTMK